MPKQKPGKSKQDYGTPDDLLEAVKKRWGNLQIDLAATERNCVVRDILGGVGHFISPESDSLSVDWVQLIRGRSTAWLNPPFARIEPWAAKCAESAHALAKKRSRILFLTPASVGAFWFLDYIYGRGYTTVIPLLPRLTFKGCSTPYPKDCMITVFGDPGGSPFETLNGFLFAPWEWKAGGGPREARKR